MLEMLQDKPLEFAGAALALIAIIVSIVIYYLQRQRKELAFGVLSEHHLLGVEEELTDRVVVTFDGQPIKNIKLVILGVKNSGNQPILTNDFEGRSMRFSFGGNVRILSMEIIRQSPKNLGCSFDVLDNEVQIKPFLLNSNDYFIVQALVAAQEVNVQVDSRIVGVPNLSALSIQKPDYRLVIVSPLFLFVFALYSMIVFNELISNNLAFVDYLALGVPFIMMIILATYLTSRWRDFLANPVRRYIDFR